LLCIVVFPVVVLLIETGICDHHGLSCQAYPI
jgi:hypothetical protein